MHLGNPGRMLEELRELLGFYPALIE